VARYSDLSVDLGRAETHDVCVTPWKQSMTCIQGTFASDLKATERKMIERYGKIWKDMERYGKYSKDSQRSRAPGKRSHHASELGTRTHHAWHLMKSLEIS